MPNIIAGPAGLHRVEHGAGGGVGLAEVPGDTEGEGGCGGRGGRCSPTAPATWRRAPRAPTASEDHDRPPTRRRTRRGAVRTCPLTVRTSRSSACATAESPELNPTATPLLSAAAVTPAPGSPASGGNVLVLASASKSTACGRSTPSPPRTSVVPTARPCTRPGALRMAPVRLAVRCVGCRPTSHVTRLRIPSGCHRAADRRSPCRRSRGRCPTPRPVPAARSPCRLLSHATGVKWSLAWELPTATPLLLTP